jgi:hypothetical protein
MALQAGSSFVTQLVKLVKTTDLARQLWVMVLRSLQLRAPADVVAAAKYCSNYRHAVVAQESWHEVLLQGDCACTSVYKPCSCVLLNTDVTASDIVTNNLSSCPASAK